MMLTPPKLSLAYEALFDWCLDNARMAASQEKLIEAAKWCEIAARSASSSGFFGFLASFELDDILLRVAQRISSGKGRRSCAGTKQQCLHVFTEAYPIFGHTKLCRKWIELDSQIRTHSLILLDQKSPIPENLIATVARGGGSILRLDNTHSLLQRAALLRQTAHDQADIVVLHTHPYDVMAPLAFGVPSGPPVAMVNHADHLFWAGRPVVDLLLEIRNSGHSWSIDHRRMSRSAIVPIPLAEDGEVQFTRTGTQLEARKALEIPNDAHVLLTVGNWEKYRPFLGLDFCRAATSILDRDPKAYMIAVGPLNRGAWRTASKATRGRLKVLGPQQELSRFHAAADVYLEGFPIGSLTALLEAAQAGLPCVRAPRICPLPFRSDGVAFTGIEEPVDVTAYERLVLQLLDDPTLQREKAEAVQRAVVVHHCGQGWRQHFAQALVSLPSEHSVYENSQPVAIPQRERDYWLAAMTQGRGVAVESEQVIAILALALRLGLKLSPAQVGKLNKTVRDGTAEQERCGDGKESPQDFLHRVRLCMKTSATLRVASAQAKDQEAMDARRSGHKPLERRLACEAVLYDPRKLLDFCFLRNHASAFIDRKWFGASRRGRGSGGR